MKNPTTMTEDEKTQTIELCEIQLMLAEHGLQAMANNDEQARAAEAEMRTTAATIYLDDKLDKKIEDSGRSIRATKF
jgi:hypothetical protein